MYAKACRGRQQQVLCRTLGAWPPRVACDGTGLVGVRSVDLRLMVASMDLGDGGRDTRYLMATCVDRIMSEGSWRRSGLLSYTVTCFRDPGGGYSQFHSAR